MLSLFVISPFRHWKAVVFLKDGGNVALVLGNLYSQVDAEGEAQENFNSKSEL